MAKRHGARFPGRTCRRRAYGAVQFLGGALDEPNPKTLFEAADQLADASRRKLKLLCRPREALLFQHRCEFARSLKPDAGMAPLLIIRKSDKDYLYYLILSDNPSEVHSSRQMERRN